jgi:hypothetical protein
LASTRKHGIEKAQFGTHEGRTETVQAWADLLDDFEMQDMIG